MRRVQHTLQYSAAPADLLDVTLAHDDSPAADVDRLRSKLQAAIDEQTSFWNASVRYESKSRGEEASACVRACVGEGGGGEQP